VTTRGRARRIGAVLAFALAALAPAAASARTPSDTTAGVRADTPVRAPSDSLFRRLAESMVGGMTDSLVAADSAAVDSARHAVPLLPPAAVPTRPEMPPSPVPADTSLESFLELLADSTDRYFGVAAAAPDTAGLDSLLLWALAHPQTRRKLPVVTYPTFAFNRVDGPLWGLGVAGGHSRRGGRIGLNASYAAGPNAWRWRGLFQKRWEHPTVDWTLRVEAGRESDVLDPDRTGSSLATMRALLWGTDRRHYLWREGVELNFAAETPLWRVGAGYREQEEKPLRTTTTWTLSHGDLTIIDNYPAASGIVREYEASGTWVLPVVPFTLEGVHRVSSKSLGSDFDYQRGKITASGKIGVGRFATLVPQFAYGRLWGDVIPQASLFLGGTRTLRSVPGSALGGAGLALARMDLLGARDLLEMAHLPHPAMFPIQGGVFIGTGAVWGKDPYGGPTRPGTDWPARELWISEAGVSLFYQPGVPEPGGFLRLSYAWPLGPGYGSRRLLVSYTRALDLVRPFGN